MSPAPAPAATIVIFGGSGDLARRKLVPALFELHRQGLLAPETAIVGFARSVGSDEAWRDDLAAALEEHGRGGADAEERRTFAARLHAVRGDLGSDASFAELKGRLALRLPADDPRRDYACIYDVTGKSDLLNSLIGRLAKGGEIVLAGFYPENFFHLMEYVA